jgi:hypothetical protein
MICCPEKDSSMCPFKSPNILRCALKYFCDILIILLIINALNGRITTATKVNCQLIVSIMIKTPTIKVNDENNVDTDPFNAWPMVSISLVILDNVSP